MNQNIVIFIWEQSK